MTRVDLRSNTHLLTRREVLRIGGMGLLAPPLITLASCQKHASPSFVPPNGAPFEGTDEQLLDEIQRAIFDFFWNEASSKTDRKSTRLELQSRLHLVCRLLLEKKKPTTEGRTRAVRRPHQLQSVYGWRAPTVAVNRLHVSSLAAQAVLITVTRV